MSAVISHEIGRARWPGHPGRRRTSRAFEVGTYRAWRQWCLTWGAIRARRRAACPVTTCCPDAGIVSTRAVTRAPRPVPSGPGSVQMGPGRGGAYTYDWIENLYGSRHAQLRTGFFPSTRQLAVGEAPAARWAGTRCCGWPSSNPNGRWCSAPTTGTGCGPSRWRPITRVPG